MNDQGWTLVFGAIAALASVTAVAGFFEKRSEKKKVEAQSEVDVLAGVRDVQARLSEANRALGTPRELARRLRRYERVLGKLGRALGIDVSFAFDHEDQDRDFEESGSERTTTPPEETTLREGKPRKT